MRQALLVGAGGFLGSICRYFLGGWVQGALPQTMFPAGTLVVNVVGCFSIGLLAALADWRQLLSTESRAFLIVGVLGGFTTFSSFAHETMVLTRDAEVVLAAANIGLQLFLGLAAAWLGYALVRP